MCIHVHMYMVDVVEPEEVLKTSSAPGSAHSEGEGQPPGKAMRKTTEAKSRRRHRMQAGSGARQHKSGSFPQVDGIKAMTGGGAAPLLLPRWRNASRRSVTVGVTEMVGAGETVVACRSSSEQQRSLARTNSSRGLAAPSTRRHRATTLATSHTSLASEPRAPPPPVLEVTAAAVVTRRDTTRMRGEKRPCMHSTRLPVLPRSTSRPAAATSQVKVEGGDAVEEDGEEEVVAATVVEPGVDSSANPCAIQGRHSSLPRAAGGRISCSVSPDQLTR